MSSDGNSAGTTGTVSNGIKLFGGTNITLSQSSGAGGATVTFIGPPAGTDITLLQFPMAQWVWSTRSATMYSGSTSANAASTHSTMSYYVQPYYIDHPVKVSAIQFIRTYGMGSAGTGSVTILDYLGLYKLNPASDSLTLVSSWLGGILYSQNSNTQITASGITGSASASAWSTALATSNATLGLQGPAIVPLAVGASSMVQPDQYFAVVANHRISNGVNNLNPVLVVAADNYSSFGSTGAIGNIWVPLNGAFSSSSSTNAAGANQWLMPPSVATVAITANANTSNMLRPPIMFRGI